MDPLKPFRDAALAVAQGQYEVESYLRIPDADEHLAATRALIADAPNRGDIARIVKAICRETDLLLDVVYG